jgi:hypothetical protein
MSDEEEEILGIFPVWMQRGGFIQKDFRNLVFTTKRLIAAKQKMRLGKLYDPDYVVLYASARERLKMKEVSAESILEADAENLEMPYSSIAVVEVKPRGEHLPIEFDIYVGSIDVPKYKTAIPIKYKYHDAFMKLLNEVLPGKI